MLLLLYVYVHTCSYALHELFIIIIKFQIVLFTLALHIILVFFYFYASEFPYIKLEKIQGKVRYYFCNYTLHSFYLIYMGDRDKQLPIVSLQLSLDAAKTSPLRRGCETSLFSSKILNVITFSRLCCHSPWFSTGAFLTLHVHQWSSLH